MAFREIIGYISVVSNLWTSINVINIFISELLGIHRELTFKRNALPIILNEVRCVVKSNLKFFTMASGYLRYATLPRSQEFMMGVLGLILNIWYLASIILNIVIFVRNGKMQIPLNIK